MTKTVVQAPAAGAPVGPYSQAVMVDGFIFVSAEKGVDPATGKIVPSGVPAQTETDAEEYPLNSLSRGRVAGSRGALAV